MYGQTPLLCVMYGITMPLGSCSLEMARHAYITHGRSDQKSYITHEKSGRNPYFTHRNQALGAYNTQPGAYLTHRNPYITQQNQYITHIAPPATPCPARALSGFRDPKAFKTPKTLKNLLLVITSEGIRSRCALIANPARESIPYVQPLRSTLNRSPT